MKIEELSEIIRWNLQTAAKKYVENRKPLSEKFVLLLKR